MKPRIVRLKSFTGDNWYTIRLSDYTCTCQQFLATFEPCKHLNAIGVYCSPRPFVGKAHPTFSQALSALVKSIRLRRIDDAVYWLVFLDTFRQASYRFRVARRILIGSAEDGHSIAAMEKVVASFRRMSRADTSLIELASEVIRICKVPNWWHPSSGGHDYIYHGLLGERMLFQNRSPHPPEILMKLMAQAIVERDKTKALCAVLGFSACRFGSSRQAEFMFECARKANHKNAARLASIHLSARGPLLSDNNFICHAAWMLAGGESPVADEIAPVDRAEVMERLAAARERWKEPEPIPQWCCDGVHSAGNDVRFMGAWHHMYSVCKAFRYYGCVDPEDEWRPEFQCYDGLTIEWSEGQNCNQLHDESKTDKATN